jgi:N-acetylglucosamine kinase-like BadF-type ATPase
LGFPNNCIASGSWFGLEAVNAVLLARDGLAASTMLTNFILATHCIPAGGNSHARLAAMFQLKGRGWYGQLAPLVFQASMGAL